MYGLIGTWAMAQAGVAAGAQALAAGQSAGRALVTGIQAVEQERHLVRWVTVGCRMPPGSSNSTPRT